jgi:hypothetical protein
MTRFQPLLKARDDGHDFLQRRNASHGYDAMAGKAMLASTFSMVPMPANSGGSGASRPSWRRYPRLPKHHDRDDDGAAAAAADEDDDDDDADRRRRLVWGYSGTRMLWEWRIYCCWRY